MASGRVRTPARPVICWVLFFSADRLAGNKQQDNDGIRFTSAPPGKTPAAQLGQISQVDPAIVPRLDGIPGFASQKKATLQVQCPKVQIVAADGLACFELDPSV